LPLGISEQLFTCIGARLLGLKPTNATLRPHPGDTHGKKAVRAVDIETGLGARSNQIGLRNSARPDLLDD
jgi:hypothetical protein